MKKFRKLSSVLMAILLLFAMVTPAGSVGIDLDETIHTGGMNDLNVRQAARDYMDIRAAYLLGETETMEWIIAGVANNEADHKTRLEECSIILIDLSYEIVLVECGGTESLVKVSETVEYIKNGIADSGTVLHELCILCNDMPFVASDAYFEAFSNFRSRSYVSPEEQEYSLNSIPNLDDQLCIIAVAYSQINQGENANGETEYGAAYGDADMEWCSAFICWCAKQANVRTTKKDDTIIYDDPTCQYCLNHYILKGQFYKSYEYGGTYVPKPGDIMFKGSRSYNEDTGEESFTSHHVGLVVSVNEEAETFKIIHGNGPRNIVEERTREMDDESIIGYAHPIYEHTAHEYGKYYDTGVAHKWGCIYCGYADHEDPHNYPPYSKDSTKHWRTCTICNITQEESHDYHYEYLNNSNHRAVCSDCMHLGSTAAHFYYANYDNTNHWEECVGCGHKKNLVAHSSSGYMKNNLHHWNVCTDCGNDYGMEAHSYMTYADGTQRCICGYIKSGSGGITPVPGNMNNGDDLY